MTYTCNIKINEEQSFDPAFAKPGYYSNFASHLSSLFLLISCISSVNDVVSTGNLNIILKVISGILILLVLVSCIIKLIDFARLPTESTKDCIPMDN